MNKEYQDQESDFPFTVSYLPQKLTAFRKVKKLSPLPDYVSVSDSDPTSTDFCSF